MVLYNLVAGTKSAAADINAALGELFQLTAYNQVRHLISEDSAQTLSSGYMDAWCEAFTSPIGVTSSVSSSSALYDYANNSYYAGGALTDESSGDTTYDPDGLTDPGNAFDNDTGTYASEVDAGSGGHVVQLGKTFGAKTVLVATCLLSIHSTDSADTAVIKCRTYNGSVWSDAGTVYSGSAIVGGVGAPFRVGFLVNSSVQGVNFQVTYTRSGSSTVTTRFYEVEYDGEVSTSDTLTLAIPTGTFSTAISKSVFVPFFDNYESGADVEYKLTNSGGDDSGWLDAGATPVVSTFTAFSNGEPDSLVIRLTPKSSSPTYKYPSLKAAWVRAT